MIAQDEWIDDSSYEWDGTHVSEIAKNDVPRPHRTGVRSVPVQLPFHQAWRWCVLTTLHDLRLSVHQHRTMSLHNTRRLFLRRFNELCLHMHEKLSHSVRAHHEKMGVDFIQIQYQAQVA